MVCRGLFDVSLQRVVRLFKAFDVGLMFCVCVDLCVRVCVPTIRYIMYSACQWTIHVDTRIPIELISVGGYRFNESTEVQNARRVKHLLC